MVISDDSDRFQSLQLWIMIYRDCNTIGGISRLSDEWLWRSFMQYQKWTYQIYLIIKHTSDA